MEICAAEPRPLYSIGTVARLSRIKPDTLRIWERRYGLGASRKSASGRRMYTQTDLEHLQMVSTLVRGGFRIGEIAAMERKTLAAMLEQGGGTRTTPDPKPGALFLGSGLCSWLDQHPGCLAGLNSRLLRTSLEGACTETGIDFGKPQLLVIECGALGAGQIGLIEQLLPRVGATASVVFYEFSSPHCLTRLKESGVRHAQLPLDAELFSATMKRLLGKLDVDRGIGDAGKLVAPQPRLFQQRDLLRYAQQASALECGCSKHLSEIVQTLVNFEEYSSQCKVESWRDAATHSCVYAYTNQARWLMEKALSAVLEEHAGHAGTY